VSKPVAGHGDRPDLSTDSFASWRSNLPRIQKYAAFLRNADPSTPDEKQVKIYCRDCQDSERLDKYPQYVRETSIYIPRQHWCKERDGEVSSFRSMDNRIYVIGRTFRARLKGAGLV